MSVFEEHIVDRPVWVDTLVEQVARALEPHEFFGPLSYRLWEPDNPNNANAGWTLAVFPTPWECRGGPHDGAAAVSGFDLNVRSLMSVFSEVNSVAWRMPTRYNGDLDGPELGIRGTFAGRDVWLRLFHAPPPDEPVSHVYEAATGRYWEKPGTASV